MEKITTETDQGNDKLVCWQTEMPPEKELWLVDQLTMLAEAFGESGERVSPQRLLIYASDLADLDSAHLQIAFTRARRELKFFPKIVELRELSGAPKQEQLDAVEADQAFHAVIYHLERNGIDAGVRALLPKAQYAVRHCGGLATFNRRLEDKSFPFLQRDFCEAYQRAPLQDFTPLQLPGKSAGQLNQVASELRQLAGYKSMDPRPKK